MDPQWSMGLTQNYFTNSDYSVVQCRVHSTCLSPDTFNQTGSHTYHYTKYAMVSQNVRFNLAVASNANTH